MSPIKCGPVEFPILRSKNSHNVGTVGLCAFPHCRFPSYRHNFSHSNLVYASALYGLLICCHRFSSIHSVIRSVESTVFRGYPTITFVEKTSPAQSSSLFFRCVMALHPQMWFQRIYALILVLLSDTSVLFQ